MTFANLFVLALLVAALVAFVVALRPRRNKDTGGERPASGGGADRRPPTKEV